MALFMHGIIELQYKFRFNLHHKYIFITPQIQIIYILRNYIHLHE